MGMNRQIDAPGASAHQAMRAEMLDAETESRLAYAWRDEHDEASLHRLTTAHMRFAISIASKFRGYGLPMNDLIQEAYVGLMKAAERFNPDCEVRFSTYARFWIKASIQDYVLRNSSVVRMGTTSDTKKLFFNLRRVRAQIESEAMARGEEFDSDQLCEMIAKNLNVSLADVEMMIGRLSGPDHSLNATQSADEEGREWIDVLVDDGKDAAEIFQQKQGNDQLLEWLCTGMSVLDHRQRYIVCERKLLGRTLQSLSTELGLSRERVRQIEARALTKMRKALRSHSREVMNCLA